MFTLLNTVLNILWKTLTLLCLLCYLLLLSDYTQLRTLIHMSSLMLVPSPTHPLPHIYISIAAALPGTQQPALSLSLAHIESSGA